MGTRVINISIPAELLDEVSAAARAERRTRSEFFREAARSYMESRRWRAIREAGAAAAVRSAVSEADLEHLVAADRLERKA
jgi:metal-responsive CopG/Arc/MetJ family transcriptional regulator